MFVVKSKSLFVCITAMTCIHVQAMESPVSNPTATDKQTPTKTQKITKFDEHALKKAVLAWDIDTVDHLLANTKFNIIQLADAYTQAIAQAYKLAPHENIGTNLYKQQAIQKIQSQREKALDKLLVLDAVEQTENRSVQKTLALENFMTTMQIGIDTLHASNLAEQKKEILTAEEKQALFQRRLAIKKLSNIIQSNANTCTARQKDKADLNEEKNLVIKPRNKQINETLYDRRNIYRACAEKIYPHVQILLTSPEHINIVFFWIGLTGDLIALQTFAGSHRSYIDWDYYDTKQRTLLYCAAKKGYVDIVEYLLNKCVECNIQRNFILKYKDGTTVHAPHKTALHKATQNQNAKIIGLLIGAGAELDIIDYHGSTPLHYAAQNHDVATVKLLLDYHAKPDIADCYGNTPLHYVGPGPKGNVEIFELLLQKNANINSLNQYNQTLLYRAVEDNRFEAVEYLLQLKASPLKKSLKSNLPSNEAYESLFYNTPDADPENWETPLDLVLAKSLLGLCYPQDQETKNARSKIIQILKQYTPALLSSSSSDENEFSFSTTFKSGSDSEEYSNNFTGSQEPDEYESIDLSM